MEVWSEETSAHVLCECEASATLTLTYVDSFSLDPEDVRSISLKQSVTVQEECACILASDGGAQKARLNAQMHRARKASNPRFYCILLFPHPSDKTELFMHSQ